MCESFRVELKVIIGVNNAGVHKYKTENKTSSSFPPVSFTKVVELPIKPELQDGDRIDVKPAGFKWSNKIIKPIEKESSEKPLVEAIDASMTLREDKNSLKESLQYLINAYEENGWKIVRIPNVWQKIIDKEDD